MLANNVPIHGIGFQSHQTTGDYSASFVSSLKTNFDRFAALGLKISITELDVRLPTPSDETKLATQASMYRAYIETVLATPACKTFMMWGFTDRHSWIPGTFPGTGEALIFDNSYQPKPAYAALLQALKSYYSEDILIRNEPAVNPASGLFGNARMIQVFDLRGARVGAYSIPTVFRGGLGTHRIAAQTLIMRPGKGPAFPVKSVR